MSKNNKQCQKPVVKLFINEYFKDYEDWENALEAFTEDMNVFLEKEQQDDNYRIDDSYIFQIMTLNKREIRAVETLKKS
jgi:hypothetical protein